MTDADRFDRAIAAFDAANAADPNRETVDGEAQPKELVYARRMTEVLSQFAPDASESLQLAARCQHIERWTRPRKDYPMGRDGYNQWRTALRKFHAERAGAILREAGYDEDTIARVGDLVQKKKFKVDPEAQALEDVVCLVFLEHYFADFAKDYDEDKLIGIVQKTWKKMSDKGHEAALKLSLPPHLAELVGKALA